MRHISTAEAVEPVAAGGRDPPAQPEMAQATGLAPNKHGQVHVRSTLPSIGKARRAAQEAKACFPLAFPSSAKIDTLLIRSAAATASRQ